MEQKISMKTLKQVNDKFTCHCGGKVTSVEMYDHDGGYPVEGKDKLQWVYCHCLKCGIDTKLAVVVNQVVK